MNDNLVKQAVWCHVMSTDEKYEENHNNAHRYHLCLFELLKEMTEIEKEEFKKRIGTYSKN